MGLRVIFKMKKYLIIGNGVAGTTTAEHIRKNDKNGSVTIVSSEDIPFYYRTRLNEYISNDIAEQELVGKNEKWFKDNNILLKLNTKIIKTDYQKKIIIAQTGETFSYDILLLATGSNAFVPLVKGSEKKGVWTLRTIKDARNIAAFAKNIKNVVLIGGGLLGLEAGNALRKLGKNVTIVEFFPRLLPRQLDIKGGGKLQNIMKNMGFSFRLASKTREIIGNEQVNGVILESGEILPADMVIFSAGVRSNTELAKSLNLDYGKGVKVNEYLCTSRSDIYAAGDVAEFQGVSYGSWIAAMDQGKIAGINMTGGNALYKGNIMANILKVAEIDLASAGDIDADNKLESVVIDKEKIYKKLVIEGNQIVGCIMLGDKRNFNKITKAMDAKTDVADVKKLFVL